MNRKRRLWMIVGAGIVFTVVVGITAFQVTRFCCALPPTPPTLTAKAIIGTSNQTLALELVDTQTAAATILAVTPSPTSSTHDSNCAFSWAHQDLPEIAEAAREVLDTISSAKFEVLRADTYGENCNRADGSTSTFAAMTTDFYLSVDVSDLSNNNQLAQAVMTAYSVLTELKVKRPAQRGYLDMVFISGGQEKHFRAMFNQVKTAIEAKKMGAELLVVGGM